MLSHTKAIEDFKKFVFAQCLKTDFKSCWKFLPDFTQIKLGPFY